MNEQFLKLAQRISDELADLDRVLKRVQQGWLRAQQSADDLYLDSVALNLHGFYDGMERTFKLIAMLIDGNIPQDAHWHQSLLQQMTVEVPGVRPAVISELSCRTLDSYRSFRHIVRNIYTFQFDVTKLEQLVTGAPTAFAQVRAELLAFSDFLRQQAPREDRGDVES